MFMTLVQSASAPQTSSASQARFAIDATHSHVGFSVRHMMITNVKGEFEAFQGSVVYDAKNPEASTISVEVDVASINTREEKRDAHLRSADFFDVEKFPKMTFVSHSVRKKGEDLEVHGDLTIHGTSREVRLLVTDLTAEHKDPWGNQRIGASAKTRIRRSDFGMQWNAALEAGGVLVGDEVTISVDVSLIRA